jgi:exodeoxyribonuclease VII small subunit
MSDTQPTFTQSLKRLEEIVQLLEKPDLELEKGLSLLEEGVKLHKLCQDKLDHTQTKITELLAQPTVEAVADTQVSPAAAMVVETPSGADPWIKERVTTPIIKSQPTTLFEADVHDDELPF